MIDILNDHTWNWRTEGGITLIPIMLKNKNKLLKTSCLSQTFRIWNNYPFGLAAEYHPSGIHQATLLASDHVW